MLLHPRPLSYRALVLVSVATALWVLQAGGGVAFAKGKKSYYFLVSKVELRDGIPNNIEELVRTQLTSAIARHRRLIEALPKSAPDPNLNPKEFARYVKKHKIQPFRINVEVTQYSHEVESASSGGQRLIVSLALRTFGETMPKRVMAFSGEGSAKIQMDIGKKLRLRDSQVASKDAAELAISDALTVSLKRLEAKDRGKKKIRRRKK